MIIIICAFVAKKCNGLLLCNIFLLIGVLMFACDKKNNIAEVPVQYFPRNAGEGKKLNNFDALKI